MVGQEPNLFSCLSLYRVGSGKSLVENYFTQAFAWILRKNREFKQRVFREMIGAPVSLNCEVRTQVSYAKARIDVEISDPTNLIFIENKLYSPVEQYGNNGNQIIKYQSVATREAKGRRPVVVLITLQKKENFKLKLSKKPEFFHKTWDEVHGLFLKHKNLCKPPWRPVLMEFLSFMNEVKSGKIERGPKTRARGRITVKVGESTRDYIIKRAKWGESIDHTLYRLLGVREEKGAEAK